MQVRKQFRRIRRFAYLGAFTGTVITIRRSRSRRPSGTQLGPPAAWPPLERAGEAPVAAVGDLAEASADDGGGGTVAAGPVPAAARSAFAETAGAWVAPLEDGSCPMTHPVKANHNSKIFHEPGGRFYDRTQAERCYVDAAAAAADGYRPAKGATGADARKERT